MDIDVWKREFKRLCTAYNKPVNGEQAMVYFAALSTIPSLLIVDAVTAAIREGRTFPSAADLVERVKHARASHAAPAVVCDVCHGEGWIVSTCTPERPCGAKHDAQVSFPQPGGRTAPRPYVHDYASRCYQCRPGMERVA